MRTEIRGGGRFTDTVAESQALKQAALQRARGYCAESGITGVVDQLNLGKDERNKIEEMASPKDGTVSYCIDVDDDHIFTVCVDSRGTIKIEGAFFIGSSKIKREDWVKHHELVDKGLTKAFKHPFTRTLLGEW